MKMNKKIAHLAVTAGLTVAMGFGGVVAPVAAFAGQGGGLGAGTPTVAPSGNVTIDEETYTDTTFKGIQIFTAKVTQDRDADGVWFGEEKTLSDIDWASDPVKSAVTGEFSGVEGAPDADAGAQTWATFINDNAGSNVGEGVTVDADSVLDKIAKALEKANLNWNTPSDSSKRSFADLNPGYWLFVTANVGKTTDANGNTDAYTSPIFTIVGGSDVEATPKKDVPNVTKAVKDDKDGKWVTDNDKSVFEAVNKAADSAMDQYIDYQLTGTVASNINTYGTYKYVFTDTLPTSMTPKFTSGTTPDVKVKIGSTIVNSNSYTASYENNVLTISFDNLKACTDEDDATINVDGNSQVTVEYQAKLDSSKIFDDNGAIKSEFQGLLGKAQKNTVKLTYSNNPHSEGTGSEGTGTTVDHPAYDYTYGIDVTKVGSDDEGVGLEGVEFTLQEKDSNAYIMANGTTTNDKDQAKLKTDADGKINVVGLDEGTYVLKEVTPAPGYNNSAANGITFTIKRDLNQTGADVIPSTDSAVNADNDVVKNGSVAASTGKLSFTVVDQKGSGLPLTGLNGVTFTWVAGGAVLAIGVAHLIRSRKQAEDSQE